MGTHDCHEGILTKTIYNLENTITALTNYLKTMGVSLKHVDPIIMASFDNIKNEGTLIKYLKSIPSSNSLFQPPFYSVEIIANSLNKYLLHDLGSNPNITLKQVELTGRLEKIREGTYVLSVCTRVQRI